MLFQSSLVINLFRQAALQLLGKGQSQTIKYRRRDIQDRQLIGYVSTPDGWTARSEDSYVAVRTGHHGPLGHGFRRGQDGHQAAIAQYKRQVRRRIVVRPLKDLI